MADKAGSIASIDKATIDIMQAINKTNSVKLIDFVDFTGIKQYLS